MSGDGIRISQTSSIRPPNERILNPGLGDWIAIDPLSAVEGERFVERLDARF